MNKRTTLALLAGSLLLASSARAGDESKELRRILTLQNGQTIRVVSKLVDGHWEYKNKRGWQELAPGMVTRAQDESAALAQFNTTAKLAEKTNLGARVELAHQALALGLVQEALAELEAVLAQDPDHAGAVALLQREDLMKVPAIDAGDESAAREALIRFAAPLGAAPREIAIHELEKSADKPALQDALAKDLGSSIVVRRSFAAHALRRIFPGYAAKSMLLHTVYDPSADVRLSCAQGLKASGNEALIVPLVRTVEDSSSSMARANAAEALGVIGNLAAVAPLVARLASPPQATSTGRIPHSHIFVGKQTAYVQDFDVEVAQFQAVADPVVNVALEGMVTDAAVSGVNEMQFQVENATVRNALVKLTGENPGASNKAWVAWWKDNGARWLKKQSGEPATGASKAG
ncbi:MAG: HEAT repeat domain-containing protein [Planctomycetes bacterium]|nr:HEAT repeat domain-containing protein [Planctomycetota bacterium]